MSPKTTTHNTTNNTLKKTDPLFCDIEHIPLPVFAIDKDGICLAANAASKTLTEKNDEAFLGKKLLDFFAPEEHKDLQALFKQDCHTDFLQMEATLLHAENKALPVLLRIAAPTAMSRNTQYVFCLDIARKQGHLKIDDVYRSFVFQLTHAVYSAKDIDTLLNTTHLLLQEHFPVDSCSILTLDATHKLEQIYPKIDSEPTTEKEGAQHNSSDKLALRVLQTSRQIHIQRDASLHTQETPAAWLGTPLTLQGRMFGVLIVKNSNIKQAFACYIRDLIDKLAEPIATAIHRKRNEAQLMHLALHDPLTGLANRNLLHDRIHQTLDKGRRNPAIQNALLLLDLDYFKHVNDTYGHQVGDVILASIASRLSKLLRTTDTVARIGGDEFIILLEDIDGNEELHAIAKRILTAVKTPIKVQEHTISVSTTIGIVPNIQGYSSSQRLIHDADTALYQAKKRCRGTYDILTPKHQVQVQTNQTLTQDFSQAIKDKSLRLQYLPIVKLANGDAYNFTAHVHWEHPQYGVILPNRFLPLLQKTGIVIQFMAWVFDALCKDIRQWENPQGSVLFPLESNQSTQQELPAMLHEIILKNAIHPARLALSIDESTLVAAPKRSTQNIRMCSKLNIPIYLSNFGRGGAPLQDVCSLPLSGLQFAPELLYPTEATAQYRTARTAIALTKTMQLSSLAVGINTAEICQIAQELQCDYAMGTFFSPTLNTLKNCSYKNKIDSIPKKITP